MYEPFEELYPCNTVIGYENGKAIVIQDDGLLLYCEMPENLCNLGETIPPADLLSIKNLPQEEQDLITEKYAHAEV